MSFAVLLKLFPLVKSIRKPLLVLVMALGLYGWGYAEGKRADALQSTAQTSIQLTQQTEALGTASERALRRTQIADARNEEIEAYALSLENRAPCIRDPTQP